jgi:REP element-mobilizing transposase RayT
MEGRPIFADATDRQAWVDRLAAVQPAAGLTILAWALLPNHVHLLVRTGHTPLATVMGRLLTGYAGAFNRRHKRRGRLFQNRYKSILVEEDPYLLELVRYIHLNPLRARLVPTFEVLDRYPWSGHSALLGHLARPWQAVREILGHFGSRRAPARQAYRAYVAAGVSQGRRPDLQGGGLRRSMGTWAVVADLRRGREHGLADERILGSGPFVESVHRSLRTDRALPSRADALRRLPQLIARVARAWGITPIELAAGSRRRLVAQARAVVSHLAVRELGLPMTVVAAQLGTTPTAVRFGLARGERLSAVRRFTATDVLRGRGR